MVISRLTNSMFMPKAIGGPPRMAVTAVSTIGGRAPAGLQDRVIGRALAPQAVLGVDQ
jgi:hypothetical protein